MSNQSHKHILSAFSKAKEVVLHYFYESLFDDCNIEINKNTQVFIKGNSITFGGNLIDFLLLSPLIALDDSAYPAQLSASYINSLFKINIKNSTLEIGIPELKQLKDNDILVVSKYTQLPAKVALVQHGNELYGYTQEVSVKITSNDYGIELSMYLATR